LGNVLEHVLDPIALLESLQGLTTNLGLLVVTVPNDGSKFQEWLYESKAIPNRWWIAPPDHISYFTPKTLQRTANATGWDCLAIQADFPIDIYLAHSGSNYVTDKANGALAHQARLQLERLIFDSGLRSANEFFSALASVGLGRNVTAFMRRKEGLNNG
jgi:hypothetical protein